MWIKNIHDRSPFSLFIHELFCTISENKVMFPISEGNLNFLLCSENLRRDLCWGHCKYKEWVSFFLGSWEMNRSAEQTNRTRTAICLFRTAIHFPWTEKKKDSHSLIKHIPFCTNTGQIPMKMRWDSVYFDVLVWNCNFVVLLHHPFWLQLVFTRLGHLLSTFENTFLAKDHTRNAHMVHIVN